MNHEESIQELYKLQGRLSAYEHAVSLMYYDGVTTAPKGTASNRAHSTGILTEEMYRISTSSETMELLEALDQEYRDREVTDDPEETKIRRMIYLMLKDIRDMQKIPMEEFVAYQELLVKSEDVWHTAKETSDFALFAPYLEEIFRTVRKFAGYCAPDKNVYDYWLNEYEPGISMAVCDEFFRTLKSRLVPLIREIQERPQVDDSFLHGYFPVEQQDQLSRYLMDLIRLDRDHCGLSTTEHPFTTSLGSHLDERITTNYKTDYFAASMYSVIHEGGHALYDTGSDEAFAYTVLDGGVSMGIHESQSRFYENIIGRSRGFTSHILPKIRELFPESMSNVTEEQFYKAINLAQPSLIRTEADEVTYCLHVMIRYELEKLLLAGDLSVKDLPSEWNRKYKEYLGIEVPDDRHGVLQDSHWSGGLIGYFPSYALGNAYGAQFLKKMKETVDVDRCVQNGDLAPVNEWNRTHIWQYGSLYTPAQILERALKEPFDPAIYMDYLEKKYREIYGI
ncbi:MAG: carboxypeptidase M32 [Parasporobacterium sp.]|nr:carboxypeptidase M32 [Parasporobacterium sp.]